MAQADQHPHQHHTHNTSGPGHATHHKYTPEETHHLARDTENTTRYTGHTTHQAYAPKNESHKTRDTTHNTQHTEPAQR